MAHTGMGIVRQNANFHGSETDFPWRKKICGEKKLAVQIKKIKKGSTSFSSALNTHETYRAHSNASIDRLGQVIVNTSLAVTLTGWQHA